MKIIALVGFRQENSGTKPRARGLVIESAMEESLRLVFGVFGVNLVRFTECGTLFIGTILLRRQNVNNSTTEVQKWIDNFRRPVLEKK